MAENERIEVLNLTDEEKAQLLADNPLSAQTLVIPSVYAPLYGNEYKYFCCASGRLSGKTSQLVSLWWYTVKTKPNEDIVVLQSTTVDIKDSLISEIRKFLENSGLDVGDSPSCEYYFPRKNDRIEIKGIEGKTYFYPITDSTGGQRTRGKATKSKVALVLYEEAQKNKNAAVIDHSLMTFVRQVDDSARFVIVGNNETAGHWFVDYVEEKKKDPEWRVIYANCFDIWGLLNERTKSFIENYRRNNPIDFKRYFLGDIHAKTSDVVFPQFDPEKHYRLRQDIPEHYIQMLFIGVDHATANDTFAIVPVAVLDDGTAQTLEVCFDDPKETNMALAPSEQCDLLEDFVEFLDNKYGIAANYVRTIISIDGAASGFVRQVSHTKHTSRNKALWSAIQIRAFTAKKKDRNLSIIKNAFAYDALVILNEGATNWEGKKNTHRLKKEIQAQRYKRGKLDPNIPNDLCDALEYALIPYYTNCYNLSYPIRKNQYFEQIKHSAGMR